jgi:predicted HTH domain antitoxin
MKSFTINIPDTIDINPREAKTMFAASLYEFGKMSLGQSAELAGYSKRAFMEILSSYNVSIFSESISDLENDIINAKNNHI